MPGLALRNGHFQVKSEGWSLQRSFPPTGNPVRKEGLMTKEGPVGQALVQSLSCVWLFVNPWTAAHQASLSITNSWSLLKLMSIKSVMLSNHLIFYHPLLLLPSVFPSIRVFSNESIFLHQVAKYWSFSFSISPSSEYSGLLFFGMDSFDLLAVQETLKSLLQHHSWKASILWCSAFFIVQLSLLYLTTGIKGEWTGRVWCENLSMIGAGASEAESSKNFLLIGGVAMDQPVH